MKRHHQMALASVHQLQGGPPHEGLHCEILKELSTSVSDQLI